ncbi:MAG: hypothetical protein ACTSWX_03010 [Promethearchaeota archaeon]
MRHEKIFFTDGHYKVFLAFSSGYKKIQIELDEEDWDWELYDVSVKCCEDENIHEIGDLKDRNISDSDYQEFWIARCEKLEKEMERNRTKIS